MQAKRLRWARWVGLLASTTFLLQCTSGNVKQQPGPQDSTGGASGTGGKGGSGATGGGGPGAGRGGAGAAGGAGGEGGDAGEGGNGGDLPPPPVDVGEHMRFWGAPHGVPGPVLGVTSDRGGGVWAANRRSLLHLPKDSDDWVAYTAADGLSDYPVISVAGGRENEVWVGYEGLFPDEDPFDDPPEIAKSGDVDRIRLTDGGLDRFHYDISSPPHPVHYPMGRDVLRTCYKVVPVLDGPWAGDVWFGCNHGAAMWDAKRGRVEEHEHTAINRNDTLFTGDFRGIGVMPDGNVWIGGSHRSGLIRYADAGGNFWAPIDPVVDMWPEGVALDPMGDDWVMDIKPDAAGGFWVASYGNGVAYRGADGIFRYIQTGNGLPDNRVRELSLDADGSVWMATEVGFARWRNGAVVQFFDSRAGLSGSPLSVHVDTRSSPRRVVMGTTTGLGIYDGP